MTRLLLVALVALAPAAAVAKKKHEIVRGCPPGRFLPATANTATRGPWHVGVRTVTLAGAATEIWYPATAEATGGREKARYDLRELLPEAERPKVTGDTLQPCDCVRDAPLDEAHGPYPVVLFVHGYTLYRYQSLALVTHWASRGFVVVSPDLAGVTLGDVLAQKKREDPAVQARAVLEAFLKLPDEVAFLRGHADTARVGLTGHSMGGDVISRMNDVAGVQVLVSMAQAGTTRGPNAFSSLVVSGMKDGVEPMWHQLQGFKTSPTPKRLVAIRDAGHLAFCDVCVLRQKDGGVVKVLADAGVKLTPFLTQLSKSGCRETTMPYPKAFEIIAYATTAALEEKLLCSQAASVALSGIQTLFPEVADYRYVK